MSLSPHYFLLRRISSLLALVPLGFFLLAHSFVNLYALAPDVGFSYNAKLALWRGLPLVVFFEVFFVFMPLLVHGLLGLSIWYQGANNVLAYPMATNIRYVLQRLTGGVALVFIGYHLYLVRIMDRAIDFNSLGALLAIPWRMVFYLVGSTAVLFHFFNGLWTALITWGITVHPAAQCWSLRLLMVVFIFFALLNGLVIAHMAGSPWGLGHVVGLIQRFLFRS